MKKILKVNKKYTHFAIRVSDNKVVNGWEQSEDIKHWSKIDLKDIFPDNKFSDFKVLTTKALLRKGIDPFNWESWAKN